MVKKRNVKSGRVGYICTDLDEELNYLKAATGIKSDSEVQRQIVKLSREARQRQKETPKRSYGLF